MSLPRKSNFELLRILAIVAVVQEHFIRQSCLLGSATGANAVLNTFLGSGGRISVNVFLILGSWFMVDATFRVSRIVKLYLEVVFYSIPVTLLMIAIGQGGGARNIIQGLLPFFGRSVWFASAYISLIALTPFLNKAFSLPRREQSVLTALLFVLFCIVSTIPSFTSVDYVADFSWFCVLYLIVGWLKHGNILEKITVGKWIVLASVIVVYCSLCMAARCEPLSRIANYWLDNIRSLPSLLCALGLFYFFLKTDIGTIAAINYAAKSVFAVYIVHQIPAFQQFEWHTILHADALQSLGPSAYAVSVMGLSVCLVAAITIIDSARAKLFEIGESKLMKGSLR